jgi:hypothetical protein
VSKVLYQCGWAVKYEHREETQVHTHKQIIVQLERRVPQGIKIIRKRNNQDKCFLTLSIRFQILCFFWYVFNLEHFFFNFHLTVGKIYVDQV